MTVAQDTDPKLAAYAHPERLVTTAWLAEHLGDPGLVVVESDEDVLLYDTGHIPGAVKIDWHTELNDPVTRDYVDGARFAEMLRRARHRPRHHRRLLRRQEQLVGHLRAVGVLPVRPPRRADPRRRPRQVGGRGPRAHHRGAQAGAGRLPGRRARRHHDPRLPRRRARAPRQAAGRRALARRVLRRAAAHARLPAGRRAARRPHPGRGERAVGPGRRRGRHVQAAAPTSRRSTSPSRASRPTTTSSPTAASASAPATPGSCSPTCSASATSATTTGQLDRVGQHRAGADRPGHRTWHGAGIGVTLPAPLAELVDDFADVGPKQRLQLLLELSRELPELPAALRRRGRHDGAGATSASRRCSWRSRSRTRLTTPVHLFFSAPARSPDDQGFRLDHEHRASTGSPPRTCSPCPTTSTSRWASRQAVSPLRLRGMSAMLGRIKNQVRRNLKSV